ncbi:MAG: hypothetical protein NXI16_13660 [Alphaproteobacteria bacterium]|nr:hypothetical protein [Alphaproteobacteria bacterium]
MRIFAVIIAVLCLAAVPAAAQSPLAQNPLSGGEKDIQDLTPSEMLRLFLPQAPQEGEARQGPAFDKEQTRRIFDRQRFRLASREQKRTYQDIADLITLILTIKKIGLSVEDTEAIAREMARISVEASRGAGDTPPTVVGDIDADNVDSLLVTKGVPLTLPDRRTDITFVDEMGPGGEIVLKVNDRAYRLSRGEGLETPGDCLLFYDDLNRPGTIAEFSYRCLGE